MHHILKYFLFYFGCITCSNSVYANDPINREALVTRHNVIITKADSLSSLSVGNGAFAFTVDVTGLQSFPDFYQKGVCLGTQSEWGWHSFPNTGHYTFEESLKEYALHGRKISYAVQWKQPERNREAADYFRQNCHRLQLGNIGFDITKKDGTPANIGDIKDVRQELNVWTGLITSHFTIEGIPVDVVTCAHQTKDMIAVKVTSALVTEHRIAIRLRLPYPTGQFADAGNNWMNNEKHSSSFISNNATGATVVHRLDTTSYFVTMTWGRKTIALTKKEPHYFQLSPDVTSATMEVSFLFSRQLFISILPSFEQTRNNNMQAWKAFWSRGGAVDLSGSTDPRAFELERRIVLSQYLTKIQCAGHYPPQETGLTYNSWYGKPHL